MATSPWLGGLPPTNPARQLPVPPQLEALLAQVQALPEDPAFTQLSADERVAWLQNLRKLVDVTESVFLQCLGDFDAQGDAQTLNAATTTAGWLRGSVGLAPGDANERVRIARGLRNHLREAGEALQSGAVSYEQVRAIEHAVRRIPEPDQAAATSLLSDLARESDVMAVRTAGEKLKHTINPDGALRIVEKDFERRHLYMSPLLDGLTHIDGLLDPESAAIVSSALAPFLTQQIVTTDVPLHNAVLTVSLAWPVPPWRSRRCPPSRVPPPSSRCSCQSRVSPSSPTPRAVRRT